MSNESGFNRRSLLKGAAGAAAAGAVTLGSKRSKVFAAPAVVAQTGSTVEITYWGSWSGKNAEAEAEVVKRFNESQADVKVNFEYGGTYEETAQKLTAALAAKQTPDVSALSDVWWFKFYLNKALAPLNDFITAEGIDRNDYVDSLINEGYRMDQQWWMPFARSTPLFYYNVDMFAEAGLDGPPETWSAFAEAAPKLVKKDGDTITQSAFAFGGTASYTAWLFQCMTWAFGGSYSDPDFTIRIAEEGAVNAAEYLRKAIADGWTTSPDDSETDFSNGLTAAVMASTGSLGGITANAQVNFKTAFLPQELGPGVCTGGAGLSILANAPAEKQQAAFKYIAFATSPEITSYWSQTTGYMPVRKSASQDPSMVEFFAQNPNFKTAVEQLAITKPQDVARSFVPGGDQMIGAGLERITLQDEDPQSVFEDVKAELEEAAAPVVEALAEVEG
jgi:sn-glycerol 3-phosphate transport system substrate-binding protein